MGGGDSSWQGHKGNLRAVIAQEFKGGPATPFLISAVAGLATSKGLSRPSPWFAQSAMASGLHFDGLEVCEVIPKGGFSTCLRQNKHGETWL